MGNHLMNILFFHGWQSTPGGVKPTYLKHHGHTVFNPHLPDDDFDAAVRIAQAEFDRHQPDVVVGIPSCPQRLPFSLRSMGGRSQCVRSQRSL
jgi:hypothetical protein